MSAVLTPGMRAVTTRLNVETGVSGFISPGDRVDLMIITGINVTVPVSTPEGEVEMRTQTRQFGEVVLSDLRVLAIDQITGSLGAGARVGATVTFEVTPKQAEMIAVARKIGELYLTLRSHTPPEVEAPPREFPFTSELELMVSGHGGVSQLYVDSVVENLAERFGLTEEESVEEPPVEEPKLIVVAPEPPVEPAPPAPPRPRAVPEREAPPPETREARIEPQPEPEPEPETEAEIEAEPAEPVVEPTIEEVRVDRAGQVQTLRFEDGALTTTRGGNFRGPPRPGPPPSPVPAPVPVPQGAER